MKYKCKDCGATRELQKSTMLVKDGKVVTKEAECTCKEGVYMEQIMTKEYEGMPGLIRTDPTLTKK